MAALKRSLNAMVRRHEALRTTFVAREGRPVQVIAPTVHLKLLLVDLSALEAEEQERASTGLPSRRRSSPSTWRVAL